MPQSSKVISLNRILRCISILGHGWLIGKKKEGCSDEGSFSSVDVFAFKVRPSLSCRRSPFPEAPALKAKAHSLI